MGGEGSMKQTIERMAQERRWSGIWAYLVLMPVQTSLIGSPES